MTGRLISFEGIEGSGKSTQIARVAAVLRARGIEPVVTRQPGGTELGAELRRVLLDPAWGAIDPWAELMMILADRAQHVAELVRPALAAGRLVLCDRYMDASVAYQGHGRGLQVERIRALNTATVGECVPERTVLLDLAPEVGVERALARPDAADTRRFDAESMAFHTRVRRGYLAEAEAAPERIRVVPADGDADLVLARVMAALDADPTER